VRPARCADRVAADRKKRLEDNSREFGKRTESDRIKHAALAEENAKKKARLGILDGAAAETGERLLGAYGKLPEPLKERLKSGAQALQSRLKEPPCPERADDRVRIVAAFGYDLQRVLQETHAVRQILQLADGQRVEADALYLGGTLGYYLAPDHAQAGLLTRSDAGWSAVPRDGIAEQVALALKIKRKETAPALVSLPLTAPAKQETAQP